MKNLLFLRKIPGKGGNVGGGAKKKQRTPKSQAVISETGDKGMKDVPWRQDAKKRGISQQALTVIAGKREKGKFRRDKEKRLTGRIV